MEEYTSNFWPKIKSKGDLLYLINKVLSHEYGPKWSPLQLSTVNYYADYRKANNRYQSFETPKRKGGTRIIHAPNPTLATIQKGISLILYTLFQPSPISNGFELGRSVVTNAQPHVGQHYVFNVDLQDFFHSISLYQVKACLALPPFNLKEEKEPLAFWLANLCTHPITSDTDQENLNQKAVLPQGAPTSPILANIAAQKLDRRLAGIAKRFGLTVTRYADDITFSSAHNVYQQNSPFNAELVKVVTESGFQLKEEKTRLLRNNFRQTVTGIVVNEKINVNRRYMQQLKLYLYLWEKYGIEKASLYHARDHASPDNAVSSQPELFERIIRGKLEYLKMVKGSEDGTFQKLWTRFIKLTNGKQAIAGRLDKAIQLLQKGQIEEAMKGYYKT